MAPPNSSYVTSGIFFPKRRVLLANAGVLNMSFGSTLSALGENQLSNMATSLAFFPFKQLFVNFFFLHLKQANLSARLPTAPFAHPHSYSFANESSIQVLH